MRRTLYGQASATRQAYSKHHPRAIPCLSFWVPFRRWLPVTAPASALFTGLAAVIAKQNTADGMLLYGGCLSLASTLLVLLSYKHIRAWRRHPSYLLLQRVINSLVFTLVIVAKELATIDPAPTPAPTCAPYQAGILQFSLLAGELWILALSVDLFLTLTDPFLSFASNQKTATVYVYFTRYEH